jgi:sterol carrier protein 2
MASKHLYGPITRFQACPPTCGAAAAVLVSPAFAAKHGLDASVEIVAQALTTDVPGTFERSMMSVVGYDMAKEAARQVYEASGVGPDDIQVGRAARLLHPERTDLLRNARPHPRRHRRAIYPRRQNTYGGKHVTNPSGGLLSKGHPLGATGLAQCYELTQQLRGTADKRQVEGMKFALQHNVGLGGACVVTLYGKAA